MHDGDVAGRPLTEEKTSRGMPQDTNSNSQECQRVPSNALCWGSIGGRRGFAPPLGVDLCFHKLTTATGPSPGGGLPFQPLIWLKGQVTLMWVNGALEGTYPVGTIGDRGIGVAETQRR